MKNNGILVSVSREILNKKDGKLLGHIVLHPSRLTTGQLLYQADITSL